LARSRPAPISARKSQDGCRRSPARGVRQSGVRQSGDAGQTGPGGGLSQRQGHAQRQAAGAVRKGEAQQRCRVQNSAPPQQRLRPPSQSVEIDAQRQGRPPNRRQPTVIGKGCRSCIFPMNHSGIPGVQPLSERLWGGMGAMPISPATAPRRGRRRSRASAPGIPSGRTRRP
jgi:hypothetical protein